MARPPRPERKTELLEQILIFLLDRSLADLTFRSLAEGLGISSYVLVYHFGSREQLVAEIIKGIEARFDELRPEEGGGLSEDEIRLWAHGVFEASLLQRGRHLQRLEFEASVQDVVMESPREIGLRGYRVWHSFLEEWLRSRGVAEHEAKLTARTFVASLLGLLYDFVLSNEREIAEECLGLILETFLAKASALATTGS